MRVDYFAHLYLDDPKAAEEEFSDDDFDPDAVAAQIGAKGADDWETLS
jgi:hypothetical protein